MKIAGSSAAVRVRRASAPPGRGSGLPHVADVAFTVALLRAAARLDDQQTPTNLTYQN